MTPRSQYQPSLAQHEPPRGGYAGWRVLGGEEGGGGEAQLREQLRERLLRSRGVVADAVATAGKADEAVDGVLNQGRHWVGEAHARAHTAALGVAADTANSTSKTLLIIHLLSVPWTCLGSKVATGLH